MTGSGFQRFGLVSWPTDVDFDLELHAGKGSDFALFLLSASYANHTSLLHTDTVDFINCLFNIFSISRIDISRFDIHLDRQD